MKEFDFTFQEGLFKGLRKTERNSRGEESLTECFNIAPMDGGIEPHEVMISLDTVSVTWKN